MPRNVQEIILILFSITILSNCDRFMCNRLWRMRVETTDACYEKTENGTIQRWLPTPSKPQSIEALYEHCAVDQRVPVFFEPDELGDGLVLISAIFSNPGNSTYEKVHLYGNAHRYFEYRTAKDHFKVYSKAGKNVIGCPVYNTPKYLKDTWDCGVNGMITEDFPVELTLNLIHAGCGYTNGNGIFEGVKLQNKPTFYDQKVYTETLITSKIDSFCDYHIFLSDVYIIGIDANTVSDVQCLTDIRKIGGRLFILNSKSKYEFEFENLEEIGENLQYGKRPIIQVVGNEIPAISFPNLKKIHCEFSTDVCVVYANNNISKFAGVYYEKVPKSEGASWMGQAPIQQPPQQIIVVYENSHTEELLIGFAVILMLVITICSFWMGLKDNDYPDNFKYKCF